MIVNKEKTAKLVRESRQVQGYTQQEVAETTGISLRSIQRIENGEVIARLYTLRILSEHLKFNIDDAIEPAAIKAGPKDVSNKTFNLPQKLIITAAIVTVSMFSSIAFISQSNGFPETTFEASAFMAIITALVALVSYRIWR